MILGHIMVGDVQSIEPAHYQANVNALLELARQSRLKMFGEVAIAKSVRSGAQQLLFCSGLGTMRPNTVFVGFYGENEVRMESRCWANRLLALSYYVRTRTLTNAPHLMFCRDWTS